MTLIFAHRGFSAKYPENTIMAFEKAIQHGADGIEFDVQFTKDKKLVVIHDLKVDRTTDGAGYVKNLPLNELRRLNANYKFAKFKNVQIPTVTEVFELLKNTDLTCIIELKNAYVRYENLEKAVLKLIYKYNFQNRVILSSFNHNSLVKIAKLAPNIETAPLYRDQLYLPWEYAKLIKAQGIHPNYLVASDEVIYESLKNGLNVRPFTVNKKSEIKRLVNLKCSAIITDEVQIASEIINKY